MAAAFGGTLHWWHGESTAGNLRESSDRELVWDSEYFREPMTLRHPFLKSIESAEPAKKPGDPWRLRLADGDVICGEITAADGKTLRLKSSKAGEIAVLREKIISAERLAGGPERLAAGAFLLGGPTEDGWGQAGQTTSKAFWKADRHGSLAVPFWSRSIFLPLKFPARAEVDFVLRSSERPRFAIGLDKNDFGKAFIETWDDEVVLSHVARFAPLLTLKDGDRAVALKWCWDSETGTASVFSASGKLLGSLKGVTKPSDYASGGLLIQNRGRNLVVESLRIRQWSGRPPPQIDPASPHVEQADGSSFAGTVESSDGKSLLIRSGGGVKTVPLAQADRLVFRGAVSGEGQAKPQAGSELWFATGEIISGKLISAKNGIIRIQPGWSAEPLAVQWKGLRSLRLAPGTEPLPPVENTDRLVISGAQFRGAFSPGGDDKLRWLPIGGVNPVEITLWPHLEIIRAAASSPQRQPALFFSKNGEVIAGEMQGMNEMFVNVKPAFAPPAPLPVSGVNAVQFAGPPLQASGFSDPGWRVLKGDDKNVIRNGGKVTLNPGGSFGHLSLLQGDEARFRFEPVNGFGTLRVRLFASDPASAKQGLALLLMHYGSQVYAGVDRGDRQGFFRENIQRRVPRGQPTRVRLEFGSSSVSLFINDVPAGEKFPIDTENSGGSGIILESAAVNGNNELPLAVSDFEIRADPLAAWSPPVDPVAKANALTVPRFRRDSPPRHVLVAQNGDLLRGTVESATAGSIRIRTGTEVVEAPRDRIAALVWLKPVPGKTDAAAAQPAPAAAEPWKEAAKAPWFQLHDGTRLRLAVEKMEKDRIIGSGSLLGRCELPLSLVSSIHLSAPPPSRAMQSYERWILKNTPDPVLPDGGGDQSPLAGTTPEDFTLPLAEGGDFTLSKHRGKVVVLDFWATWCGPCVMAMPGLITAMKSFPTDKAAFVAVNQGEPADLVKRFLVQRHWELPVALDADQKIARKFAVQSIPHTVVIGPDGKIAHVAIGYQADGAEKIAEAVRRLMP